MKIIYIDNYIKNRIIILLSEIKNKFSLFYIIKTFIEYKENTVDKLDVSNFSSIINCS